MKKIYLLFSCVLCSAVLIGQPTLQYPQNAPQIGDLADIYFVSTTGLSTGDTGPNAVWDYSLLTTLFGGQITVIDPAQAPAGNEFPTASAAMNMGDTIFTYILANADGIHYLGSQFTTGTFPSLLIYSDSRTFLKFPFTYDDTYFDTYKGITTTSVAEIRVSAASEMFADAYGTLTTPAGTFSNVLRTITVDAEIDSVFVGGVFMKAFEVLRSQYSWFAENSKSPLLSIEILDNTYYGSVDTVAYYSSGGTGISNLSDKPLSQLSVFPNPADDHVMVEFNLSANMEANISIVSQVGQVVISHTASQQTNGMLSERIDISTLPSGIYFANVMCSCGKQLTAKFVIR